MAIPTSMNRNGKVLKKPASNNSSGESGFREKTELPKQPARTDNTVNTGKTRGNKKTAGTTKNSSDYIENSSEAVEDGYAIDPKTGVKYKLTNQSAGSRELSKVYKKTKGKMEITIDMLRRYVGESEDFQVVDAFNGDDLTNLSKKFLGHLQVPPSKEEIERMRQIYAQRRQQAMEEYQNYVANIPQEKEETPFDYQ